MKQKLYLLILCALVSTTASAQHIMVVEQNDNTTTEFNVDDIKRVYFKNKDTPTPSNSVLSSRLKDKDGNPIRLTYVGNHRDYDENNGYGTHFFYDENGTLTSFSQNAGYRAYFIDGLSYHSYFTLANYYQNGECGDVIDVILTLNDDGLVSSFSYEFKEMVPEGIDDLFKGSFSLAYNSEKQLVKAEADFYSSFTTYDESKRKTAEGRITYNFIWEGGNIVKKDVTYLVDDKTVEESFTISYGEEPNLCRQYTRSLSEEIWGDTVFSVHLLSTIGLFGVGPVNLPVEIHGKKYSYTLNPNGTIATENDNGYTNDIYIYK